MSSSSHQQQQQRQRRVLVVDKGFGMVRGKRLEALLADGAGWEMALAVVPEPVDALEAGVALLRPLLASFPSSSSSSSATTSTSSTTPAPTSGGGPPPPPPPPSPPPDVVVAGSRGGKYVAALLRRGLWRGPTLLISSLSTSECCSVRGVPIVLAHGTRDGTNPIHRVRDDVQLGTKGLIVLHEFDDDHGLTCIEKDDTMLKLLEEVYALQSKVAECMEADGGQVTSASGDRMALFEQIKARRMDS